MQNVSITELTPKRKNVVTERIARYWSEGYSAKEVAAKIKISPKQVSIDVTDSEVNLSVRSIASYMGNLTKLYVA